MVISADGSATVNGEPVVAPDGESVDVAVLDALHQHAREAGTGVTAAIADASGYVAYVEVAPDGSSRMLEEAPEGAGGEDGDDEPGAPETELAPAPAPAPAPSSDASFRLPEPESAPAPAPALSPSPSPSSDTSYRLPEPDEPPLSGAPDRPLLTRTPPPEPAKKARQSDDEYEGPGLLHRPMVIGPVSLGVAALVIIPLVVLGSNSGGGGGDREKAAGAGSSARTSRSPDGSPMPTVSVSPSTGRVSPSPSPSVSGSASASAGATPSESAGGALPGGAPGATVTVTARPPKAPARETVIVKPPADTAATAVNRLFKQDPNGRHICYRVYVGGQGWQRPVCDGTLSGTTGQNKSIKAVNISVRGVNGSAANDFVHNPTSTNGIGVWKPNWTAIQPEGTNIYIGSSRNNAPDILAFAMNVGSGRVCQNSSNFHTGWRPSTCSDSRPQLVTIGGFGNEESLEAVKLTV